MFARAEISSEPYYLFLSSGCWQDSVPCSYRSEIPIFLLAVSWGVLSAHQCYYHVLAMWSPPEAVHDMVVCSFKANRRNPPVFESLSSQLQPSLLWHNLIKWMTIPWYPQLPTHTQEEEKTQSWYISRQKSWGPFQNFAYYILSSSPQLFTLPHTYRHTSKILPKFSAFISHYNINSKSKISSQSTNLGVCHLSVNL